MTFIGCATTPFSGHESSANRYQTNLLLCMSSACACAQTEVRFFTFHHLMSNIGSKFGDVLDRYFFFFRVVFTAFRVRRSLVGLNG